MGKRGPKVLPLPVKNLRGTARKKDRQQRAMPEISSAVPECPDWLPGEARAKWIELAPMLHSLGLLAELDAPAFALMLMHWSLARRAAKAMQRSLTTRDERGLLRKNPASQIFRDHSTIFRNYAAQFGMVPLARMGLDLKPEQKEENPFAVHRR